MSRKKEEKVDTDLDEVLRLVGRRTGLSFAPGRNPNAELDIRRAMERVAVSHAGEYRHRLTTHEDLLDDLVEDLTVGETYFFREPEQLEFIRRDVLPEILRRDTLTLPVRVWSAGCATGEEAYTIAILLEELGVSRGRVVGTDISRSRLARAARGRYRRWSLRGVADPVVQRCFQQRGKTFELTPEIRSRVDFRYLNLAGEEYPSLRSGIWGMDLILCRNVLIYLDEETIAAVAGRLMGALGDDGWLFLGASDPSLSGLVPCEVVTTGAGIAYRRPSRGRAAARVAVARSAERRNGSEAVAERLAPAVAVRRIAARTERREEPKNPGAMVGSTAVEHYRRRDYAAAAPTAREEIRRGAADPGPWITLVRALANQGLLTEARRECLAALARHPSSAELLYLDAILLSADGLHESSAVAARRAVYADRSLIMAHLALGSSLLRLGERAAALRSLRNAERLIRAVPPNEIVPASDGEIARVVGERVRSQLALLQGSS